MPETGITTQMIAVTCCVCLHNEWLGAGLYLYEIIELSFAPVTVESASCCAAGGGHMDEKFLSVIAFQDSNLRVWGDATSTIGALRGMEFA
jgi:hypothetical protein